MVALAVADSSKVSSGVEGLGGDGPLATNSGCRPSALNKGMGVLSLWNGLEKLLGDVCSGRALTTLGMRPTWGSLLGRPVAGRTRGSWTWVVCGMDAAGAATREVEGVGRIAGEVTFRFAIDGRVSPMLDADAADPCRECP